MTGICDKCRRPNCFARMPDMKRCDLYMGGETNYERLFGTPERAAMTLALICVKCEQGICNDCGVTDISGHAKHDGGLLKWLESEAQ